MVKQNKQINDRNSNQVKGQKKENKEQTSKKKTISDLKEKVNSKQNISKEFKKIMAKETTEKKKDLTQQRK